MKGTLTLEQNLIIGKSTVLELEVFIARQRGLPLGANNEEDQQKTHNTYMQGLETTSQNAKR